MASSPNVWRKQKNYLTMFLLWQASMHCVKDYWIRTEKYSVFVSIKTRIAINGNTSLNMDEYVALFSLYSVVFYSVMVVSFISLGALIQKLCGT